METPIDLGLAFHVGELYHASKLINDADHVDSVFKPLDTGREPLQTGFESPDSAVFNPWSSCYLLAGNKSGPQDTTSGSKHDVCEAAEEKTEDVSMNAFDLPMEDVALKPLPSFCTWEAFKLTVETSKTQPLYISEAGPGAFDTLYAAGPKNGQPAGVLPRDVMLRALSSLVLGRSSTLFRWNEAKQRFEARLENNPISGTSLACSTHTVNELAAVGTTLIRMWNFASPQAARRKMCPAMVAMQSCTATVLNAIEESISAQFGNIQSILQLQSIVVRPRRLLGLLSELTRSLVACKNDESVISIMSDFVKVHAETTGEFCAVLRLMLEQTSIPWLEQLAIELNFRSSSFTYSCGKLENRSHGIALSENISFLQAEDQDLIVATKAALDVIREHTPDHAILTFMPSDERSLSDILVDPHFDVALIDRRASELQEHVSGRSIDAHDRQANLHLTVDAQVPTSKQPMQDIWTDHALQEDYISGLEAEMSQDVETIERGFSHELRKCVLSAADLLDMETTTDRNDLTLVHGFPFERIRPLIEVQSRLANGIVIRQLIRDHKLMQHLALHRSYYLFGSGEFTTQLSTALFSPDLQSAERKRGRYATSEPMGLRLASSDAAQKWPPASSELSMVLVGVLSRVVHSEEDQHGSPTYRRESLQNRINFAIRELSEQEIDLVMDAHSIHALDLLGLQYNAPAPLDLIITPELVKEYDSVFRLLLLLMRLIHSTSNLPREPSEFHDRIDASEEIGTSQVYAFMHQAHHVVAVILSHFMDVGIASPWQTLCSTMHTIIQDLQREDESGGYGDLVSIGLQGLQRLHSSCLHRIRSRLFLRSKQHKVREALEDLLATILRGTALLQGATVESSQGLAHESRSFHSSLAQLVLVLEEYAGKALKSKDRNDTDDAEAVKILLSRLEWRRSEQR